jgi:hypothetical protein
LLPIGTDVTYDHILGRNTYISKRPKRQWRAFHLAFLSSALGGVLLALVERIGMNKTAQTMDFSNPRWWDCAHFKRARLLSSVYCYFVFMAPILPSRRCGYQFRAEELKIFLDLVKSCLLFSSQNWQAVADVHLENYRREAQFQEIAGRTGLTGDPNCPNYVIRAKQLSGS